MVVALNTLHMSAVIRVTLSPVLHDAPFVGSVSFCFLDMPYLDFDLRWAPGPTYPSAPDTPCSWICRTRLRLEVCRCRARTLLQWTALALGLRVVYMQARALILLPG